MLALALALAALTFDIPAPAAQGAAPALPRFAPRVAIEPIDAVVFGGSALPFSASVTGDRSGAAGISWHVLGSGSIAADGRFLAPLGASSAIVAARVDGMASAVRVSIAQAPSDRRLLLISCYEGDSIDVRDPTDFRRLGEVQAGPLVSGIAVDTRKRVAFVAARGRVFGLDLARMTAVASDPVAGARFSGVAPIAGGLYAATDNNAGAGAVGIRLFRITQSGTPVLVRGLIAGDTPEGIAATADGKTFYVTNVNSNQLMRFDAAPGIARLRAMASTGPRPFGLALDERLGLLFVADNDTPVVSGARARPGLEVFNAATLARVGAPLATGSLNSLPIGLAVDIAAARLFVTNEGDDDVVVYALPTMRRLAVLPTGSTPWTPRVDGALHRLYVPGARSDTVDVYDTHTLRRIGPPIQTCRYPTNVAVFDRSSP